jgi:hypothetical protein
MQQRRKPEKALYAPRATTSTRTDAVPPTQSAGYGRQSRTDADDDDYRRDLNVKIPVRSTVAPRGRGRTERALRRIEYDEPPSDSHLDESSVSSRPATVDSSRMQGRLGSPEHEHGSPGGPDEQQEKQKRLFSMFQQASQSTPGRQGNGNANDTGTTLSSRDAKGKSEQTSLTSQIQKLELELHRSMVGEGKTGMTPAKVIDVIWAKIYAQHVKSLIVDFKTTKPDPHAPVIKKFDTHLKSVHRFLERMGAHMREFCVKRGISWVG